MAEESEQQKRIQAGLADLLTGEDKGLTVIAALSIAATTAHQLGMPKLDLQKMLIRMYDQREKERQHA